MKAIILAAGKGRRLDSDKHGIPKAMRKVAGKPMLNYVTEKLSFCDEIIIVVGYKKMQIIDTLGDAYTYVEQKKMLGTGHATAVTEGVLADYKGPVLIAFGDMPLFRISTYKDMFNIHKKQDADCTNLTVVCEDDEIPHYGRIIRDANGQFVQVKEHKDCDEEERKIRELNVGVMVCNSPDMFEYLKYIDNENTQGEYYITALPGIMLKKGLKVTTHTISDMEEALGVNTQKDLDRVEKVLLKRRTE